jgi:hypothetical protein
VLKAIRKARAKETPTEPVKAFLLGLLKVIPMTRPKELLLDLVLGLLDLELEADLIQIEAR